MLKNSAPLYLLTHSRLYFFLVSNFLSYRALVSDFFSYSDVSLSKRVSRFKARFHYERGKKHSLFVLLIFFFALPSILTARFNRRSIKERKNALFHARSGNGP